ncbi:hypothetical protein RRU01S_35_00350 [Agrobacterium rubi TR3 = NBRC 13261]|uniref:Ornithine cyclodeaminase n=1 Tax=Agrobacterium rubi TR3 = NBRC 13261 TaxID=1368415 RepID=A0A081D330_9HYPH|nr:hypothetical protein RRU01S_35_00350 [Agrobacterium rubi TR3 = NBRC 13261]
MKLRHLDRKDIDQAADLDELIEDMDAFLSLGVRHRMQTPLRTLLSTQSGEGLLVAMPSYSPDLGLFTTKLGTVIKPGGGDKAASVNTLVAAFDAVTGRAIATVDGCGITHLKCAALTAVVTRYCSASDAHSLGVVGAGALACAQIVGIARVRQLSEISVYARSSGSAEMLRRNLAERHNFHTPLSFSGSVEEAVRNKMVVATSTTSRQALIDAGWLVESVHVNCMGARSHETTELDPLALKDSILLVEDVDTAVQEAGPTHRSGIVLEEMMRLRARLPVGRTVFSSSGHGAFDMLATAHVIRRAGLLS